MAKKKDQRRMEELEDIRAVMATGPGFRFFKRLIAVTGPFRSTFNSDHAVHSFLEGERNIGARFLNDMLAASPELATRILVDTAQIKQPEEANNEHTSEEPDETTAD